MGYEIYVPALASCVMDRSGASISDKET